MRNEVKVGILAVIAVAFSFYGYKFIQGKNLLSGSNTYYAFYEDINGLTIGSSLKIAGVNIGSVSEIVLDQQTRKVKVTLEIDDGFNIPKGSLAYIASDGLLGGTKIDLFYSTPCSPDGSDCLPGGSEIEGRVRGMLSSFLNTDPESPTEEITTQVDTVVSRLNDEFFGEDSQHPIARSSQDLATVMNNLKGTTAQLQQLMAANSRQLTAAMNNLASLTGSLANKQEAMAGIIDNTNEFTSGLSKLELEETIAKTNQSIAKLQGTLAKADQALGGVSNLMTDLSEGKGTIGKLLSDDEVYNRLDRATRAADTLFTDFQERPYRYIPFKSRKRVIRQDRKDEEKRADEVTAIPDDADQSNNN